jgi:hypothetical protein
LPGERECERDARTARGSVLGPDLAAVCFDEALRDREAESGATGGARS